MKSKTLIAGGLIALLNALVFVPAVSQYAAYFVAASLALAVWLVLKVLVEKAPEPQPEIPGAPKPVASPTPPKTPAEADVLAVIGTLQNKGRLVDFVMDDISKYDDAQVGAAARVVHEGCKAAFSDLFTIEPVASEREGSKVTVPEGSSEFYRLSGSVSGEGPATGILVHKGWKATRVNLPRVINAEEGKLPPIAPAQVEVK